MSKWFKIFFIGIICILVIGCSNNSYKIIDSNEAMDLIKKNNNVKIIDVRESDEFNTGHIKNAYNIPLSRIENIDYEKDTIIILYCATGVRSAEASKILSKMGYTNLYNLDGGLLNWGFDLE